MDFLMMGIDNTRDTGGGHSWGGVRKRPELLRGRLRQKDTIGKQQARGGGVSDREYARQTLR